MLGFDRFELKFNSISLPYRCRFVKYYCFIVHVDGEYNSNEYTNMWNIEHGRNQRKCDHAVGDWLTSWHRSNVTDLRLPYMFNCLFSNLYCNAYSVNEQDKVDCRSHNGEQTRIV